MLLALGTVVPGMELCYSRCPEGLAPLLVYNAICP